MEIVSGMVHQEIAEKEAKLSSTSIDGSGCDNGIDGAGCGNGIDGPGCDNGIDVSGCDNGIDGSSCDNGIDVAGCGNNIVGGRMLFTGDEVRGFCVDGFRVELRVGGVVLSSNPKMPNTVLKFSFRSSLIVTSK